MYLIKLKTKSKLTLGFTLDMNSGPEFVWPNHPPSTSMCRHWHYISWLQWLIRTLQPRPEIIEGYIRRHTLRCLLFDELWAAMTHTFISTHRSHFKSSISPSNTMNETSEHGVVLVTGFTRSRCCICSHRVEKPDSILQLFQWCRASEQEQHKKARREILLSDKDTHGGRAFTTSTMLQLDKSITDLFKSGLQISHRASAPSLTSLTHQGTVLFT